jgi:hypothetical protein
MHGKLIDSLGNECALVGIAYAPCMMERDGMPVSEALCPRFQDGRRLADLFAMTEPARVPFVGMTSRLLTEMGAAIGDIGYHVSYGKKLYEWADTLKKAEVTHE